MIAQRYVMRTVALAMAGTLAALALLMFVFGLLGKIDSLSSNYTWLDALYTLVLDLPNLLLSILPSSMMMGAVIGLSILASSSELTVLRASGVPVWRIVSWALLPTTLFIALQVVLIEWVAPYAHQQAVQLDNPSNNNAFNGHWLKQGQTFVYISHADHKGKLFDLRLYTFDASARLATYNHADSAVHQQSDQWQAAQLLTSRITPNHSVLQSMQGQQAIGLQLPANFLQTVAMPPDSLGYSQLWQYIGFLKSKGYVADKYVQVLALKLAAPLQLIAVVIIGCAFVFGSLREKTMGYRIVMALFVGIGLRYAQDLLGHMGSLFAINPIWVVVVPLLLYFAIGLHMLRRAQ